MKAYRLLEWQRPPELCDVEVPDPGPGEVLLRVGGSGACHSDLHIMRSAAGERPWTPPFTLGHENAGWVEATGRGAAGFAVGDAVAVYGPWGCGLCRACLVGRDNYCERRPQVGYTGGGLGIDGGMAEYMIVPATRLLVPIDGLEPADAAPLTDAALTSYHAIKHSLAHLVPGSTALVIGVGGLGHLGVQLLKALSAAQVVAVDIDPAKLELARTMGADLVVAAGPSAADAVRDATRGLGAEVVLDFTGRDDTLALAAASVRFEGSVSVVGAGGGRLDWAFGTVAPGASWSRTLWGSLTDFAEVLELARAGVIHAHIERFALDQADAAYDRLRAGTLQGRAVIVPHQTKRQESVMSDSQHTDRAPA
jgi:propanol-preferring alcohol dehydrogenase